MRKRVSVLAGRLLPVAGAGGADGLDEVAKGASKAAPEPGARALERGGGRSPDASRGSPGDAGPSGAAGAGAARPGASGGEHGSPKSAGAASPRGATGVRRSFSALAGKFLPAPRAVETGGAGAGAGAGGSLRPASPARLGDEDEDDVASPKAVARWRYNDAQDQDHEEELEELEEELKEGDGEAAEGEEEPGSGRERQRRRDNRMTRAQKRYLRGKREAAKREAAKLEAAPNQASAKVAMAEYIAERRRFFEAAAGRASEGTSKLEHPAVRGHVLEPLRRRWDVRKSHPIFFGYDAHPIAEDTVVRLDLKLLGVGRDCWTAEHERIEAALVVAVRAEVAALGVPAGAVSFLGGELVRGENLRRLKEKLERRAKGGAAPFAELLANLSRSGGGAVNVRVSVRVEGTRAAFERRARYVVPEHRAGDKLEPEQCIEVGILDHEQRAARALAGDLAQIVDSGALQARVRAALDGAIGQVSLAANFAPAPTVGGRAVDFALPGDTPRMRRSRARVLTFEMAAVLEKGHKARALLRLGADEEASGGEDAEHEQEGKDEDWAAGARRRIAGAGAAQAAASAAEAERLLSRPQYERARTLHPAHFDREARHVRPDAHNVSPIFWGDWLCPQVPAKPSRPEARVTHPAFFGTQDWVPPNRVLHRVEGASAGAGASASASPSLGVGPAAAPRCVHPCFFGLYACEPDENGLLARRGAERSEVEDVEEDEKFLKRARGAVRSSGLSAKRNSADEAEAKAARERKERERMLKRNVHPAVHGYKTRTVPLLADAVQRVNPASFGYETGPQVVKPLRTLASVVHPAVVGFRLVVNEMACVERSSAVLNPIFFGLSLEKGPRYEAPQELNEKLARRRSMLDKLSVDPKAHKGKLCKICLGADLEGCPRCWRPERWERDGSTAGVRGAASFVVKALVSSPSVRERGHGHGSASPAGPNAAALPLLSPAGSAASPSGGRTAANASSNSSSSDNNNKQHQHRATHMLQLKAAAAEKLKEDRGLNCPGAIEVYRRLKACYITIFVKSLPTGDVTRLRLQSHRTLSDLYLEYRCCTRTDVGCLTKLWLVLPLMTGLVCLDATLECESELLSALEPGRRKLCDFGLDERNSEVCMFQLKDLYHPAAQEVARSFISQNVNLARKLDVTALEQAEHLSGAQRAKLQRYQSSWGTSLSIKSRINELRITRARATHVAAAATPESTDRSQNQSQSQSQAESAAEGQAAAQLGGGDASQGRASDVRVQLPQIGQEILERVRFDLLFLADQIRRDGPIASDLLQQVLVREMHDLMRRQREAWAEAVVERERFVVEQRRLEQDTIAAKRRAESAGRSAQHLAELREGKAARAAARAARAAHYAEPDEPPPPRAKVPPIALHHL